MKRVPIHILLFCAVAMCLFFSCGKKEARVIPRSKMAKIYAEMLMTDQWISSAPSMMRIADTSLVYEPILEKYGYDSEDYRRSVEHYLDDPERFSKIFRSASEILDGRLQELKALQKTKEEAQSRKYDFGIDAGRLVPDIGRIPLKYTPDSLAFELDTVHMYYVPRYVERGDTAYKGPEIIVCVDSIAACDSVAAADTAVVTSVDVAGNEPAKELLDVHAEPLPLPKGQDAALSRRMNVDEVMKKL